MQLPFAPRNPTDRIATQAFETAGMALTEVGTLQHLGTAAAETVSGGLFKTAEVQAATLIAGVGTVAPGSCSISGKILYENNLPAMRIYWREVLTGRVGYLETAEGDDTYLLPELPPGVYNVMAWFWPQGASGAVTITGIVMADTAAKQNQCADGLAAIPLLPGQTYTGADIGCWGGDFFSLVTPGAT